MKLAISLFVTLLVFSFRGDSEFLKGQKQFDHVKAAYADKEAAVTAMLKKQGIGLNTLNILLVAYKAERQMELYARNIGEAGYRKIAVYDICALSGQLGPKRQEGDRQVPEGFYNINVFNPSSNYYLSLGINYPNQADLKKTAFDNPGGNIFIHGACVTIGCLPMTDDKIKEIYLYAVQARHSGQQQIPVYIFPFRMTAENMTAYQKAYVGRKELMPFWNNLKTGFDAFQKSHKALKVKVDARGDYVFN